LVYTKASEVIQRLSLFKVVQKKLADKKPFKKGGRILFKKPLKRGRALRFKKAQKSLQHDAGLFLYFDYQY